MPEKVPSGFTRIASSPNSFSADDQLGSTPYPTGNDLTVADLGLYPISAGRKALIDGAGLKSVAAWGDRVGNRPGIQKGMRLEN
jgi:glutathione S-transferase